MGRKAIVIVFRGGAVLELWGDENEVADLRKLDGRLGRPVRECATYSHSGGAGSLMISVDDVVAVSFSER